MRWVKVKAVFAELSALWRELPAGIRALWERYAALQGNAYRIEKNEAITYKYCPIPNYPPRPKLMEGYNAFVGLNARAGAAGFEVPSIHPPLDVSPPQLPGLDIRYDHRTKELVVILDVPKGRMSDQRKAILWITARYKAHRIAVCSILDVINLSAGQQKLELRYKRLAVVGRRGCKPIEFGKFGYLRAYLGAQILQTPGKDVAPIAGAATIKPYYILNELRYLPLEDLIQTGSIKNVGAIRFSRHFYENLKSALAKIGAPMRLYITPDKRLKR